MEEKQDQCQVAVGWRNMVEEKEGKRWATGSFFRIREFHRDLKCNKQVLTSADVFPVEAHSSHWVQFWNDLEDEQGIPWAYIWDVLESPEKFTKLITY